MKRTISSGSGSVGRRSLLGAAALAAAAGVQSTRTAAGATNSPPMNRHLLVDDRISDLLQHPAFAGFARLLLPGGSVTADPEVPLRDIGSLMPYHSRVHPPEVVAALNRLIDDTRSGHVVFHDIYTAAEKRRDPSLEATGLFFLRGRPGAPFALVAPGGGFSYVATLHEGLPYALQINRRGYNAFVLVYRVRQGGTPATRDLAVALSNVVRHAAQLAVSSRNWSLWGSSAGARMVAAIGTHGTAAYGGDELPRPAAVVMAYTGHSEIARQGETDPPKLDDLQDFITCYNPENRHERVATERFKFFSYEELMARDKASLDIFWLKDDSLDNLDDLPPPDLLQQEIIEHLEAALASFRDVAVGLRSS